jgi:transposase
VCLLHPAQMHAFAQQRGLRAKTDQVDATTIARALLSGEARFGYVPTEQVATYRELVRLQQQRESMMSSVTKTRSTRSWWFSSLNSPRFLPTQHDLQLWHSSSAIPAPKPSHRTRVGILSQVLHELSPKHYGRRTAEKLLDVAKNSVSSGVAISARSTSLRILCDQLEHTQANLNQLQQEIETLLDQDPKAKSVLSIPEFGVMTVAVLRAELGDLDRFARMDQIVAYVGLDLQVKQSGKWIGQTKLSKRGSGRVRRIL